MNFRINLIKNSTLPLKKRKAIFLSMVSYLSICAIIFIILCIKIRFNFAGINRERENVARAEKTFCQSNPSIKSASTYNADMRSRMIQHIETLEAVEDVLSKRINLTPLLIRFALPLPSDAYIDNFKLDTSKKGLSFSVITPSTKTKNGSYTSGLISAWKNDSILMANIKHIESSASQRKNEGKDTSLILEFSCSLAKGDK